MDSAGRSRLKDKKRIVIKIGTSSLTHKDSKFLNLRVVEALARVITDLHNSGKDVVLVSSGAIAVGRQAMHVGQRPSSTSEKQALAAIGQAQLIMAYKQVFSSYNQQIAQLLLTKYTILDDSSRQNARNTFDELFSMNVVPIINENDTVATHEIEFGDNDRLGAIVSALIDADLMLIMTDFDGLYTSDPSKDPNAVRIPLVPVINDATMNMAGSGSSTDVGTGGMDAKLVASKMATDAGADVIIMNGDDPLNIYRVLDGQDIGTLFLAHEDPEFDLLRYISTY